MTESSSKSFLIIYPDFQSNRSNFPVRSITTMKSARVLTFKSSAKMPCKNNDQSKVKIFQLENFIAKNHLMCEFQEIFRTLFFLLLEFLKLLSNFIILRKFLFLTFWWRYRHLLGGRSKVKFAWVDLSRFSGPFSTLIFRKKLCLSQMTCYIYIIINTPTERKRKKGTVYIRKIQFLAPFSWTITILFDLFWTISDVWKHKFRKNRLNIRM